MQCSEAGSGAGYAVGNRQFIGQPAHTTIHIIAMYVNVCQRMSMYVNVARMLQRTAHCRICTQGNSCGVMPLYMSTWYGTTGGSNGNVPISTQC
jgi:hypothetical protein